MSIILKRSSMVRPAEQTPKKILWLSGLDMIIRTPYSHNHALYTYPHNNNNNINENCTTYFDGEIIKESLSKALVAFYPMAGRLKMNESNGRYEIDCNEAGALFVEAETTNTLDELMADDDLKKLTKPSVDYSGGLSSFPLLMVQLTRFRCGGVCLCFVHHHHALDGDSSVHFTNSWARLARGLDIAVMPVLDRQAYLSPRNPPRFEMHHPQFQKPLPPLIPRDSSGETSLFDGV